jgi:hypothetical protein
MRKIVQCFLLYFFPFVGWSDFDLFCTVLAITFWLFSVIGFVLLSPINSITANFFCPLSKKLY